VRGWGPDPRGGPSDLATADGSGFGALRVSEPSGANAEVSLFLVRIGGQPTAFG